MKLLDKGTFPIQVTFCYRKQRVAAVRSPAGTLCVTAAKTRSVPHSHARQGGALVYWNVWFGTFLPGWI